MFYLKKTLCCSSKVWYPQSMGLLLGDFYAVRQFDLHQLKAYEARNFN